MPRISNNKGGANNAKVGYIYKITRSPVLIK